MLNFLFGFITGVIFVPVVVVAYWTYDDWRKSKKREQTRLKNLANPQIPLRSKARSVVRSAVHKERDFRRDYGYSISLLVSTLERQFEDGMTFDNYGKVWEIDHIDPLKSFNLLELDGFKAAIHPRNLQPLFRGENQSKGAK